MRVAVVATCPFPAGRGSPLLVERTCLGLAGRGHDVLLLAPDARESGRPDPLPVRRARGGTQLCVDAARPQWARVGSNAALLALALRTRADVVVGHNADGGAIAGLAARARGVPALYVRHSDTGSELAPYGRAATLAGRALDGAARHLCTRTIELAAIARTLPGLDALPPPADPGEAPVEPGDGATLYYEGNRDPYQNLAWLDVALRAAREVRPDARLLLAAGPRERPARADLALLPRSLAGGFPMKLLAYQVAGIPAVCVEASAPGLVDGEDAFVVPGRGSPEAFARRVAEALADHAGRARLRTLARERALSRHAPEHVAALFEASLHRALGHH
jgi:glycosyltransferase involved in cell wall biosynthesis